MKKFRIIDKVFALIFATQIVLGSILINTKVLISCGGCEKFDYLHPFGYREPGSICVTACKEYYFPFKYIVVDLILITALIYIIAKFVIWIKETSERKNVKTEKEIEK